MDLFVRSSLEHLGWIPGVGRFRQPQTTVRSPSTRRFEREKPYGFRIELVESPELVQYGEHAQERPLPLTVAHSVFSPPCPRPSESLHGPNLLPYALAQEAIG